MKALILSGDGFEDSELLVPADRLREAGYGVEVAAAAPGTITGKHGAAVPVDRTFADVDPAAYGLLLLPGGKAPTALRQIPRVLEIARAFVDAGTPVGAICHGPQILASAGLLAGRRATCYRTVAVELMQAGARYMDREVVVDGTLVTSRMPADLPAFMGELMRLLAGGHGKHP